METALRVAAGVIGAIGLILLFESLARAVLIPHPVMSLFTRATRVVAQAYISLVARRGFGYHRQHRLLSGLGPLLVLGTLFVAVVGIGVTYALLTYALSPVTAKEATYQAGSALLTLGLLETENPPEVAVAFLAAFTGMALIAVLIGYLLALFTSYTGRETMVTKSSLWAGEPSWGPELLCRRRLSGAGPMDPLTEGWIDWVCEVRSSHIQYPVLSYFRSASATRGWLNALLARLDAAALEIAVTVNRNEGDCASLLAEGSQTFRVLRTHLESRRKLEHGPPHPTEERPTAALDHRSRALYHAIRTDGRRATWHRKRNPESRRQSSITRPEFDHACELMSRVGIELRSDRDAAFHRFLELRSAYEFNAYRAAERIHAVPAPWSGPRRGGIPTLWPTLSATFVDPE
ncbi:MAG: hypothetical protein V9E98_08405 [Candidatus Nanopelagicales bacterium]